ncbi:MAG: hypothetical protein IIA68_10505, partial [Proteobacteria bacterium]|nr:hypothetical protein [Pseudomonadota bacterium]
TGHLRREFSEGKLGYVEFAVGGKARETLVMAEIEPIEINALGSDVPEPEIAEMIVIRGRDGKI